ncbi:MAG: HlyD family efflux transporter periplasmic adaptor subunit [Chromatiales bacterium]|jgi:RND family efflux transporter MFP subunit
MSLQDAATPTLSLEIADTWMAWQCRMVAGIIRGALYLTTDLNQSDQASVVWPNHGEGMLQLGEAAKNALDEGRGLLHLKQSYGPGLHRTCDIIATPIMVGGKPLAVVAVMISPRSESQQQAIMQLLQWGGVWLETLVGQKSLSQQEASNYIIKLMSTIHGHDNAHTAAHEAANQLADRLNCERVSVGFRRGLTVQMEVLSHVASFDARSQLARRIEAAMEEALDHNTTLVYPSVSQGQATAVCRAHQELLGQHAAGSVCTLPLPGRSGFIGALTLERSGNEPAFDQETVAWCETLSRILGPALELKQREERSFWLKAAEALRNFTKSILGPSRLKLKLGLAAVGIMGALIGVVKGDYRITAPATIEGAVRQLLVAPQAGYVKDAMVRAGDLVSRDQLIATLDDRQLSLEHQKWQGEINKVDKEYQEALAKRDRVQLSIHSARLDQVETELHLVEEKLARTQLRAPFKGVVVNGDLSQSLGAPVERGQILFEIAPLDSYRVVLEVDEHDMQGITAGKSGHLVIAALPQKIFSLTVEKVVPVAVADEGRNFFRVEASLDEPLNILRPGMQGVGKIEMGRRSLLWIWTHSLIDRLRLWAWSLGL